MSKSLKDPHNIIIRPVITEKSFSHQEDNTYTFEVARHANKPQIKDAVEALFEVTVVNVRTMPRRSKNRRRGWTFGRTRQWKKAMVKLGPEDTLDIV